MTPTCQHYSEMYNTSDPSLGYFIKNEKDFTGEGLFDSVGHGTIVTKESSELLDLERYEQGYGKIRIERTFEMVRKWSE